MGARPLVAERTYQDYLRTDHWRSIRARKLQQSDYKCQLCGCKESLEVHHNTYCRVGSEDMSDLIVLCRECHEKHHGRVARAPERVEHMNSDFWPPVHMSDGRVLKGPGAELVGRYV